MTKVAILPVTGEDGSSGFRAIAGTKQSRGKTAGAALDALTPQLSEDEAGTLVMVQTFRGDRFFSEEQRQRLMQLMGKWRQVRDSGGSLPSEEEAELDELIDAEVEAS